MLKDRIKELREKNNLTKAEFAKSVGISPTSASLYESGRQNPGKRTIAKICEVYGVDEAWLTITESAPVAETPTTTVADKGEKKSGRKAEKTDAIAVEEKKIDKTAILARVAEIGVRKAAEEAGVAWQTVNKWKKDAEKAAATEIKEVMKDLPTVEDIKESVGELTTPADLKAGLEAIATVVEMTTPTEEEKAGKKKQKAGEKKSEKNSVNIIIQSPMGGAITPEQILAKIPAGADSVYVRVDENKLYWVKGDETGAVEIWE